MPGFQQSERLWLQSQGLLNGSAGAIAGPGPGFMPGAAIRERIALEAGAETTQGEPIEDVGVASPEGVTRTIYNGVGELPGAEVVTGAVQTSMAGAGVIGGGGVAPYIGVGTLTLGVLRQLLIKFGPTILKALLGAAAFSWLLNAIGLGLGDDTPVPDSITAGMGKKKRRRYTIGSNPRVRTLQKVSRHCQRLLKRHEKVIREFLPKPRKGIPASAMSRTYLSTAERKQLAAGG